MFLELAEDISKEIGPSRLVTGDRVRTLLPSLEIRQAPAYDKRSMPRRALSWIWFTASAMKEVMKVKRAVPLVMVSNPPVMPLLGLISNIVRRQHYIIIVYDIYPDALTALGRLRRGSIVFRIWSCLVKLTFSRAAHVITLGRHMAGKLEPYLADRSCKKKLYIVPTWVDTTKYVPIKKKENWFAVKHGQTDKLTILYSGNIGFTHDIEILIDAAEALRNEESIHFLIIGEGPSKARLLERALLKHLQNITFLPIQDGETFPFSLACGDIAIVSIRKGMEGLMMPSKAYYSMAVGSALLGLSCAPNDLADLIQSYGCGLSVAPGKLEGLVEAIQKFKEDGRFLDKCKTNSRIAAQKYFSRASVTPAITELAKAVARG